jgi:hypothetical protein
MASLLPCLGYAFLVKAIDFPNQDKYVKYYDSLFYHSTPKNKRAITNP